MKLKVDSWSSNARIRKVRPSVVFMLTKNNVHEPSSIARESEKLLVVSHALTARNTIYLMTEGAGFNKLANDSRNNTFFIFKQ